MSTRLEPTFAERDLVAVERAFERLLAEGMLAAVPATADGIRNASLPAGAEQFRRLAARFKSVTLVVAEITFHLDRCGAIEGDHGLGAWSVGTDSPELDIRIGHAQDPDMVFDLTWSPKSGDQVIVHSTFLHFIVRAAAGDAE